MAQTQAQTQTAAQAVAICAIISGMQLDSVARATAAATLIQFALPALCLQLNFLWLALPPPHFPLPAAAAIAIIVVILVAFVVWHADKLLITLLRSAYLEEQSAESEIRMGNVLEGEGI